MALFTSLRTSVKIGLFCAISGLIYGWYFFPRVRFTDTAHFGGDTWEYQSMAVNFARGHGLTFGGIDSFDTYKFSEEFTDVPAAGKADFLSFYGQSRGRETFYRTPGYPLFLGLIYKISGVSPLTAKRVQLGLLVIIGAFLPYLGWTYWGWAGFIAGIPAGLIFLKTYVITLPKDILSESLIAFSLFVWLIFQARLAGKLSAWNYMVFGLVTGAVVLIKASSIFIPILYLAYLLWKKPYTPNLSLKRSLVMFALGLTIILLPWSLYASYKSGRIVLLSTQGRYVLLETNNEFTRDGSWKPSGYSTGTDNAFYRQKWIQPYPNPLKVVLFYAVYPQNLAPSLIHKLHNGFDSFPFLKLTLIGLVLTLLRSNQKNFIYSLPSPVWILFLNYLLITLIFFGTSRFTQVIDFLFILSGTYFSVLAGWTIFRNNHHGSK